MIRLYTGDGIIEIPAKVVLGFEEFAEPAPAAAATDAAPQPIEPRMTPPLITDPRELVRDAARRSGLPPAFVESVALVESAFRPEAISPKGAIGIMQLMPATAKALGADPHDPRENVEAGTRLLRDLLVKYDGDVVKALSAYNAGEGAVARYRGLPPYAETRSYVNKVIGAYIKAGGK